MLTHGLVSPACGCELVHAYPWIDYPVIGFKNKHRCLAQSDECNSPLCHSRASRYSPGIRCRIDFQIINSDVVLRAEASEEELGRLAQQAHGSWNSSWYSSQGSRVFRDSEAEPISFIGTKLALLGAMASVALLAGSVSAVGVTVGNPSRVFLVEECSSPKIEHDFQTPRQQTFRNFRLGKFLQRSVHSGGPTAQLFESKSVRRVSKTGSGQQMLREQGGESAETNYDQIVKGHSNIQQKREMFTGDAWLGMMRLQRYNSLLEDVEEQERQCPECTRNRRLLEQVWQTVSNEYFDQYGRFSQTEWSGELFRALNAAGGLLHSRAEAYKAIKEMVARLGDSYSSFLTPEEYRIALHRPMPLELKYLIYQYTGVGIQIGERYPNGGFRILSPFAGSPAEEAGILGGERLLSVDGFSVDTLTKDEAVTLLRGPIGSLVELEVMGDAHEAIARTLLVERRALPLPPLKLRMVKGGNGLLLAYIRLYYFTHDGTKNMASAIREGESLGVDGYILDLRNNPGGVFEEAIAMAALWLDCKDCGITETVRTSVADIDDFEYMAGNLPHTIFMRHPGVLTHAPLVIISNRNSASASEVLIGALHDNERTWVLGEKTFGKGVVQYYFPMDDGSGLKLTVAKYLTPKRYDISKQGGLLPDRFCGDYPHAEGSSDKCINEAVRKLQSIVDSEEELEQRTGVPVPAPMPYRWLPLNERQLRTNGYY